MKKPMIAFGLVLAFFLGQTFTATPAEAQWLGGGYSNRSVTVSSQQPLPGGGYASSARTQSMNSGEYGYPTVSTSGYSTVTQPLPNGGSQTISRSYNSSGPEYGGYGYPAYGYYGHRHGGHQIVGPLLGFLGGLVVGSVLERAIAPQPVVVSSQPAYAPAIPAPPQPQYYERCDGGYCVSYPRQ